MVVTMRMPRSTVRSGFTLAEVVISLGIFAYVMVALLGMVAVGLESARNASAETRAATLLTALEADLASAPPGGPTPVFGLEYNPASSDPVVLEFFLSDNRELLTSPDQSRFAVRLTLETPSAHAMPMRRGSIKIWWPGPAAEENAAGTLKSYFAHFDREAFD